MRILVVVIATALSSSAMAKRADPLAGALTSLATAANCADKASPWRPWCIAATGWSTGAAAALPTGNVLVGLTIELEDGQDLAQALSDRVSLSAFAVDKDGKVKVTTVKPENEAEKQSTFEAVFALANLFKGKTKVATLPKDLASYLGGLSGKYATTKAGGEWTWQGESAGRARKVGTTWVVIETPAKANGYFVTILTDAWN